MVLDSMDKVTRMMHSRISVLTKAGLTAMFLLTPGVQRKQLMFAS